ncbi:MAG: histone deacetylase, partial [Deltaproteobacteria bacterium]|nr:histone deacetylase [Deltaproteobacteria bacterium]
NFSAQGYAQLTSILKPDIAVLEGGYSIEGALPYVNVGIILALAGIDYHNVKEPDYQPEKIRQNPAITQAIEKIGETVLTIWHQRENIKDQIMEKTDPSRRHRDVYYDTDGIQESQHEQIQVCDTCAGALRIDSTSSRGFHILAVHVPRMACNSCKQTGYDWYESADPDNFNFIFLQDRTEDRYRQRKNEE